MKNKKIFIYGVSSAGKRVFNLLQQNGNPIKGFIDKRAKEIVSFNNIKVFTIEELACEYDEKDDIIIIICIRNVFEHNYIANDLYQSGFKNIIYKPKAILNGRGDSRLETIDIAYEKLINQGKVPEGLIAKTDSNSLNLFKDVAFIKDEGECESIVLIPKHMLFTNTKNGVAWQNINIAATFPGVFLYEYFEGKSDFTYEEIYNLYINQFSKGIVKEIGIGASDSWGNTTIQGRQEVYIEMNSKFALDTNFFMRNCPMGNYSTNESRIEVTSSGKNRISFLIAKGVNYIPMKLYKEDYGKFINLDKVKLVINYINNNHIKRIKTVIEHPYFYDFPTRAGNYLDLFVVPSIRFIAMKIHEEIGKFEFSDYLICDVLEDDGLIYRYLKRMRFQVERPEKVITGLEKKLNDLFYLANSNNENNLIERKYFAVFLDSNTLEEFFLRLNGTVKYCFLCIWKNEDNEVVQRYGLKKVKLIFHTIWDGREVKGILYEREQEYAFRK